VLVVPLDTGGAELSCAVLLAMRFAGAVERFVAVAALAVRRVATSSAIKATAPAPTTSATTVPRGIRAIHREGHKPPRLSTAGLLIRIGLREQSLAVDVETSRECHRARIA
jgi:hypothetical protein